MPEDNTSPTKISFDDPDTGQRRTIPMTIPKNSSREDIKNYIRHFRAQEKTNKDIISKRESETKPVTRSNSTVGNALDAAGRFAHTAWPATKTALSGLMSVIPGHTGGETASNIDEMQKNMEANNPFTQAKQGWQAGTSIPEKIARATAPFIPGGEWAVGTGERVGPELARGDIAGAVGEVTPAAAVASLSNPRVRATAGGAVKGAWEGGTRPTAIRAGNVNIQTPVPSVIAGGAAGAATGGYIGRYFGHPAEGAAVGGLVGGGLPIIKGAIEGGAEAFRSSRPVTPIAAHDVPIEHPMDLKSTIVPQGLPQLPPGQAPVEPVVPPPPGYQAPAGNLPPGGQGRIGPAIDVRGTELPPGSIKALPAPDQAMPPAMPRSTGGAIQMPPVSDIPSRGPGGRMVSSRPVNRGYYSPQPTVDPSLPPGERTITRPATRQGITQEPLPKRVTDIKPESASTEVKDAPKKSETEIIAPSKKPETTTKPVKTTKQIMQEAEDKLKEKSNESKETKETETSNAKTESGESKGNEKQETQNAKPNSKDINPAMHKILSAADPTWDGEQIPYHHIAKVADVLGMKANETGRLLLQLGFKVEPSRLGGSDYGLTRGSKMDLTKKFEDMSISNVLSKLKKN